VLRVEGLPRVHAYIMVASRRRKRRDAAVIRNIYAERSCPRARAVLLHISTSLSLPDQAVQLACEKYNYTLNAIKR